METLADYYIARNVKIIRSFNVHRKNMTVRDAFIVVGEEYSVSKHTVERIIYSPTYAYAAEAHAIVNKEESN